MTRTAVLEKKDLLSLNVPEGYQFELACRTGHCWKYPPYFYDSKRETISYVHDLGTIVCRSKARFCNRSLEFEIENCKPLDPEEKNLLIIQLRRMYSLDWNLRPFHKIIGKERNLNWIARYRLGWFLRSPSFFEDVVKVLLCANSSSLQSGEMLERLTSQLGKQMESNPEHRAFPSPETIVKAGVPFLRDCVKAGYRSQMIAEAAHRFFKGEFQEADLLRLPTLELRKRLLSFRGLAPAYVRYLMILLGKFDDLSLDGYTVTMDGKVLKNLLPRGSSGDDLYRKWGEWSGLVAWFDLHLRENSTRSHAAIARN